jgi:hypothetical protein
VAAYTETAARVLRRAALLALCVGSAGACNPRRPLPRAHDGGPAVETVESQSPIARPPALPSAPAVPLVAEHEPNDDAEHAQTLDATAGVRGSLAPPTSLGAGKGDDDYYVYRSPETAQLVRIEVTGSPVTDLQLELLSATGQRLALVDEHARGEGEQLTNLVLAPNQTVYVRVRGSVAATGKGPAEYEYQLSLQATPAPPGSELEPNDSALLATPAVGSDLNGALSFRKDEDYWMVSLPEALGRRAADPAATADGIRAPAVLRVELFAPGVVPSVRVFVEAAPVHAAPAAIADGGAPPPAPPAASSAALPAALHDGGAGAAPVLAQLAEVSAAKGVAELRLRNLTLPAGSLRAYVAVRGQQFIRPPGEARYHLKLTVEPALDGAEVEPNDDSAQANLLKLTPSGAGSDAEVAGFLWPGDSDSYRLRPPTPGPLQWQIKLALPGGDCQATLELVRGGEPPVKAAPDPSGGLALRTRGDVLVRVSSRERKTCFDAPYRLTAHVDADASGAKP